MQVHNISSAETLPSNPLPELKKKYRDAADPHKIDLRPIWTGKKVICIACGPSLTQADVEFCEHKAPVIAINNAYTLAPWADILYAGDAKWWIWNDGAKSFAGWKLTREREAAIEYGIDWIPSGNYEGLSEKSNFIHNGFNSGYQAINIAYLLGAREIYLLGYDMQTANGHVHFFGLHPDGRTPPLHLFIQAFNGLSPWAAEHGLKIVNMSRETALTCFHRQDLRACF